MTTDYIDIIKELHDIAQGRELPKQAREILSKNIKDILDKDAKSKKSAMTTQEKGASYWKGGLP